MEFPDESPRVREVRLFLTADGDDRYGSIRSSVLPWEREPFFRDVLTLYTGRPHADISSFTSEADRDVMDAAVGYAGIYRGIEDHDVISPRASTYVHHLNRLGYFQNPFVMSLVAAHGRGEVATSDAEDMLEVLENYCIRSYFARTGIAHAQKVLTGAAEDIPSPREFARSLLSMGYPDDDAFRRRMLDLRKDDPDDLVLSVLEGPDDRSVDVLEMIGPEGLTVEHIMPRHLTREWRRELGKERKSVHQEWTYRLGNLTLLPAEANLRLGNNSYDYKRRAEVLGYMSSDLWLNESVKREPRWGEAAIARRNAMLAGEMVRKVPDLWRSGTFRRTRSFGSLHAGPMSRHVPHT